MIQFDYVVTSPSIGNAGNSQVNMNIAMDSDFECHYFLGRSDQDLKSDIQPCNFSVRITNQTTGRQLSTDRVPASLMCPIPHGRKLLRPIIFSRNTVLQFDFLNLTAVASVITFVLSGFKILIPGAQ